MILLDAFVASLIKSYDVAGNTVENTANHQQVNHVADTDTDTACQPASDSDFAFYLFRPAAYCSPTGK